MSAHHGCHFGFCRGNDIKNCPVNANLKQKKDGRMTKSFMRTPKQEKLDHMDETLSTRHRNAPTLLSETIAELYDNGMTEDDVLYVRTESASCSWLFFTEWANFWYPEFNSGINRTLKVVGKGWWLERHYDDNNGSSWWEFKTQPERPQKEMTKYDLLEESRG